MPHLTPEKQERVRELRRHMTPAETVLWQQVRAHRMCGLHFRRQHVIAGFIVDFYCHAARLVVEVDGTIHAQRAEYDTERTQILEARGLRVLRFSNERVLNDLPAVLADIRIACRDRLPPPLSPTRARW